MDAQVASGVSDKTSPTRRESPVQFKQKLVIAFVRRTDGLQILTSDRTFPADHLCRPFREGTPISFEPDVREHPRPAAIAGEEGEGLNPALWRPVCPFPVNPRQGQGFIVSFQSDRRATVKRRQCRPLVIHHCLLPPMPVNDVRQSAGQTLTTLYANSWTLSTTCATL